MTRKVKKEKKMGLSNNKMLFSPFFVLREYIFSFQ